MLDVASGDVPPVRQVRWRRRILAMAMWAVLFVAASVPIGIPTDPAYAFVWLWALAIAWNSDRPWREHLRFGRDWWRARDLLVAYTLSRGYADDGAVPHVHELVSFELHLSGWDTGGHLIAHWLRRELL